MNQPTAPRHVVALAASAGGLKALTQVLSGMKADFDGAIMVVEHLRKGYPSYLAEILDRATELPVYSAVPGMRIREGAVYVAPPDNHLLVDKSGDIFLSQAEPVLRHRPSANLLFQSVAEHFRERAIAVVLTGMGKDGTAGIAPIKENGGRIICQDEATSDFFAMPSSAIATGLADEVVALEGIGPAIVRMCAQQWPLPAKGTA